MKISKAVARPELREGHFRTLAVAIALERDLLDVHSASVARKQPRELPHREQAAAALYALSEAGLIEPTRKDDNSLTLYRVTPAGYARAGVRPPLWIAA